jgi:hypothetical protein
MQHEDDPADRDANHERDSNRVRRCDGGLFLQVWQDKPRVYLSPSDALSLLQELTVAFRSTGSALRRDQDDTL